MKISELYESVDKDVEEIDKAYEEVMLISKAVKSGNFGVLIGKNTGKLTIRDINNIRRRLEQISKYNPLIRGNVSGKGKERVSLLWRRFGHGLEGAIMGTATVGLGFVAIATGPVGTVASVIGASATGTSAIHQARIVSAMNRTSRLIALIDQYEKLQTEPSRNRSILRRIFDVITRKRPWDIEKEIERRVKQAQRKATLKFERDLRRLPHVIEYVDGDGEIQEISLEELFNF